MRMLWLPEKGLCVLYAVIAGKLYLCCVLLNTPDGIADRVIIKIIDKAAVFFCICGKQQLIIVLQRSMIGGKQIGMVEQRIFNIGKGCQIQIENHIIMITLQQIYIEIADEQPAFIQILILQCR